MVSILKILTAVLAFANFIASSKTSIVPFILNGTIAETGQFPYFAKLEVINNEHLKTHCGASIISENWLITMALCFEEEYEKINAYFGMITKNVYESSGIIENGNVFTNDDNRLALLKVTDAIEFSDSVQPIGLPNIFMLREFLMNQDVFVTGLGYYQKDEPSEFVRYAKMRVFSFFELTEHQLCKKYWSDKKICLASNDDYIMMAYTGDSGDPVSQKIFGKSYLVAIIKAKLGEEFNTAVTIYPYIFWIERVTGLNDYIYYDLNTKMN